MECLGNLTRDRIIEKPPVEFTKWALDIYQRNAWLSDRFDGWCVDNGILWCPAGNSFSWGEIMGSFYMRQMPGFQWVMEQLEAGKPVIPWAFRD